MANGKGFKSFILIDGEKEKEVAEMQVLMPHIQVVDVLHLFPFCLLIWTHGLPGENHEIAQFFGGF